MSCAGGAATARIRDLIVRLNGTVAVTEPREDSEIPAFLSALGLPGLADVHVHFMPERLMSRVWQYFDDVGASTGLSRLVWYRLPEQERVDRLRKLGVRVFTALAYPHKPGMTADLNVWTLTFGRATDGCLLSATLFPEPDVREYVGWAVDAGAQVFKVHLQVGGFDPNDPLLDPVWGLLSEAGVPVVVHAGHMPAKAAHTGPEPFERLLRRDPRLPAVIAHMGAPDFDDFLRLAQTHERVMVDTTMVFTSFTEQYAPFPERLLPLVRDLGLAGKILLGSDFPNIPSPYAEQLAALVRLDLGEQWLRAVCWDNADRLFGPLPDRATRSDSGR